jgi:transcriptional regulator
MAEMPETELRRMMSGIVGFELEVEAWRPTFKLSQNKPPAERKAIATALQAAGSPALAELMLRLVP